MYQAHGGSGYAGGHEDVLAMDFRDALRFVELLNEAREREAKAMKRAQSR